MVDLPEICEVPIESVQIKIIDNIRMQIVFITKRPEDKKQKRIAYLKQYYLDHPEKYKKKKKPVIVKERAQDRIDKTFRAEDERLKKIKYSYCQNACCTKPNKKYVAGSGVMLDYKGLLLYFCSERCSQDYQAQAGKVI